MHSWQKFFCSLQLFLFLTLACSSFSQAETRLRVMTFNVWGAGSNAGLGIEQTVAVIQAANPDIIGMQEIRTESEQCDAEVCPAGPESVAPQLAAALGYELLEQLQNNELLWANAILSRFPIRAATPGGLGARIDVNGRDILLFNIHTTDFPYGPYQLLSIPYGTAPYLDTAEEAIAAARQARDGGLLLLQADLNAAGTADATFITGDFNEPSFRDWNQAAAKAGVHPLEVAWPFTRAIEQLGFTDVFRAKYPDPLVRPGFSWSPTITVETNQHQIRDHSDRIDFIFARTKNLQVINAQTVGEPGPWSDISVEPYPSDHRAVVAEISF